MHTKHKTELDDSDDDLFWKKIKKKSRLEHNNQWFFNR
jgi:hypothetical protein